MTDLSAKIPDSLFQKAQALAEREQMSIDQFVTMALASQVSAWLTKDYLSQKAQHGSWNAFEEILAQVPDVPADECDRL